MIYTQQRNVSKRAWLALLKLRAYVTRLWLRLLGPRWTVGCLVIFLDEQSRVCLLKHRGRVKPWGLPGGLLAWPESPQQGLVRELKEELSWSLPADAATLKSFSLEKTCISAQFPMLELIFRFSRPIATAEIQDWKLQRSEILEVGWFSQNQIAELDGLLERHRALLLDVLRSP
jgi:ADP-ribose pyrophosphatase YjhB (NUDIX family)